MKRLTVSLEDISVEGTDDDQALLQKANAYLPRALEQLAKSAAKETVKLLEDGFRRTGMKATIDKPKALRDAERQFLETMSAQEKQNYTDSIFEQLREQRDAKRGGA